MKSVIIFTLEMLCYSGNIMSGIIASKIWRIQEKTLINKMFMVYFVIDCSIGAIDPYFLFKLFKERLELFWLLHKFRSEYLSHFSFAPLYYSTPSFLRYDGELKQEHNCIYFLSSWMLWGMQRQLYNAVMMALRYYKPTKL